MGRFTSTLCAASAATVLTVGLVSAQTADRKTIVTVSGPVSIPGATLPAGTYVFRLADSPTNRHVVQIFDRDEAKLITTLLAVPSERDEADGDPLITFKETPSDRPPAVRYWYYAGEKNGNEFVYPKAQAMMIARASGESVSSVDSDAGDIEGWKGGSVTRVTADTESQATTASAPSASGATSRPSTTGAPASQGEAPQPTAAAGQTTATSAATTPAAAASTATPAEPTTTASAPSASTSAQSAATSGASAAATQPEHAVGTSGRAAGLPKTASPLPMVGLIGVLSIVTALGVRVVRRSLA